MLDHEACMKRAKELAQADVDAMYPNTDQKQLREAKLREFTDRYYLQMVTPPRRG